MSLILGLCLLANNRMLLGFGLLGWHKAGLGIDKGRGEGLVKGMEEDDIWIFGTPLTNSLGYTYHTPTGNKGKGGFTLKRAYTLLCAGNLSTNPENGNPLNYL